MPKTIENMRVYDETMVNPEDEEVMRDEAQDETASYFNREKTPKILITTCDRPSGVSCYFRVIRIRMCVLSSIFHSSDSAPTPLYVCITLPILNTK